MPKNFRLLVGLARCCALAARVEQTQKKKITRKTHKIMTTKTDLMLHCGAAKVERAAVEIVPTPDATDTWTPIPHTALIERVEDTLKSDGLTIVTQTHSLTRGGNRYFGLMQIANGHNSEDYAWVLGLRNSHDKSFPAGLVVGASVFVCDNLSFSGEIRMTRKHTVHIMRDLPGLVQTSIGQLVSRWHDQDTRIEAYKQHALSDMQAHDLVVRAIDARAATSTQVPPLLQQWRHPKHEAFQPRTAWSLFNSFTEVMKGLSLNELSRRTQRLHGLFDTQVGLTFARPAAVIEDGDGGVIETLHGLN
jgi:hypothetical protein